MPSKEIGMKYKSNPANKEDAAGGIVETEQMKFKGTHENLNYTLKISGTQSDVQKAFSTWPIEVGETVKVNINTKLSKVLITAIAEQAAKDAAARKKKGKQTLLSTPSDDDDDIDAMSAEIDKV